MRSELVRAALWAPVKSSGTGRQNVVSGVTSGHFQGHFWSLLGSLPGSLPGSLCLHAVPGSVARRSGSQRLSIVCVKSSFVLSVRAS